MRRQLQEIKLRAYKPILNERADVVISAFKKGKESFLSARQKLEREIESDVIKAFENANYSTSGVKTKSFKSTISIRATSSPTILLNNTELAVTIDAQDRERKTKIKEFTKELKGLFRSITLRSGRITDHGDYVNFGFSAEIS